MPSEMNRRHHNSHHPSLPHSCPTLPSACIIDIDPDELRSNLVDTMTCVLLTEADRDYKRKVKEAEALQAFKLFKYCHIISQIMPTLDISNRVTAVDPGCDNYEVADEDNTDAIDEGVAKAKAVDNGNGDEGVRTSGGEVPYCKQLPSDYLKFPVCPISNVCCTQVHCLKTRVLKQVQPPGTSPWASKCPCKPLEGQGTGLPS